MKLRGERNGAGGNAMSAKILFYRYGSICEPDVIDGFCRLGLEVKEEVTQVQNKQTTAEETVRAVTTLLQKEAFLFVFSINFFPAVSESCQLFQIPYVCWVVDCPVMELFSPALKNNCNRVFLFDRAQYRYFRPVNREGIFHLPLATNTDRWDYEITNATVRDRIQYAADVSFVGSLYSEKNPMRTLAGVSEYGKGYLDALTDAQMKVYGGNFIEDALTVNMINEFDALIPEQRKQYCKDNPGALRYLIAHQYIGAEIAEKERRRLLTLLARNHTISLYTRSDVSCMDGVKNCGGVKTLTEMPMVFHFSRVNLNITIRSIQTGLSLRLFDICGCGGFLLTNYQEELEELYTPGEEAEVYASEEELLDKADFYLAHEDAGKRIAGNGYIRTKETHNYPVRLGTMIRLLNATI